MLRPELTETSLLNWYVGYGLGSSQLDSLIGMIDLVLDHLQVVNIKILKSELARFPHHAAEVTLLWLPMLSRFFQKLKSSE